MSYDPPRLGEVCDTPELRRILALPRRDPSIGAAELAERMTAALRTPWGSMRLWPKQALALYELCVYGTLFAPLVPGDGKTLISLLAPTLVRAKRPVLLLPKNLEAKTGTEFQALAYHWQCTHPDRIRRVSYELLSRRTEVLDSRGRVVSPALLDALQPDLIVADEAHELKNPKASCTAEFLSFCRKNPKVPVVTMSGTFTNRSPREYSHLALCSLKTNTPVPTTAHDLEALCLAIDEKPQGGDRLRPGALSRLGNDVDPASLDDANVKKLRQAWRGRLRETPGVVVSDGERLGVSLQLLPWQATSDPALDAAFLQLRKRWQTPDGTEFSDPMTLWRHARELGQGLYYRWNPPPPQEWRDARRQWNSLCREILESNRRGLRSEEAVKRAVGVGLYDRAHPEARQLLDAWHAIRGEYSPDEHKEAVWVSYSGLEDAKRWVKKHGPGVIWVEHVAFGQRLSDYLGLPYYREEGKDAQGRAIEEHPPNKSAIASVDANFTGRNLQFWSRCLVMSCGPVGRRWEQLIARLHRNGQTADTVRVWVYDGCWEHIAGVYQARRDAVQAADALYGVQRLGYADWLLPTLSEIEARGSARWDKFSFAP